VGIGATAPPPRVSVAVGTAPVGEEVADADGSVGSVDGGSGTGWTGVVPAAGSAEPCSGAVGAAAPELGAAALGGVGVL
jgi:hypothetical protein